MLNTSATGALIQCHQAVGELEDELLISLELQISSMQKYLRIRAVIRNLILPENNEESADDDYRYGVQFVELDEDQRLILNAYVHEQVVLQLEE